MKYFNLKTYTTYAALKERYHALAKKHHPDYGGKSDTMQEINAQYKAALELLSERLSDDTPQETLPVPRAAPPKKPAAKKKRAPAKQKAKPKRGKTLVDILADVAIYGVEQLRERLREK